MTTRPRIFLLDENIPKQVLSVLRVSGYVVTRVRDEQLGSQADTALFVHACARRMTIVTFDTDYLSRIKFQPPHAGILVLRFFPRGTSIETIASVVLNAVKQFDSFDLSDHVYTVGPDTINEVFSCEYSSVSIITKQAEQRKAIPDAARDNPSLA